MLLNVIKHQRPNIDKIHLYAKDQLLINVIERLGNEVSKYPKAFVDDSETIDNVYVNLEDYNPIKERRMLIVFH